MAKKATAKNRTATKQTAKKRTAKKQTAKKQTAKRAAARPRTRATGASKAKSHRTTTKARMAKKSVRAKKSAAAPGTQTKKAPARSARTTARRQSPLPPSPASRAAGAARAVTGAVAGTIAAIAARMPWSTAEPDALQMLEQEHRRLEDLLKRGEETSEAARRTRRELLKAITAELTQHEEKEEQILYPALQAHPEARDIVSEGYQEHHIADVIVEELHAVATDDEAWGAKFKVLKENIEHHIKEEEGEMFRLARGIFSRDELQDLGVRMRELWPRPRE